MAIGIIHHEGEQLVARLVRAVRGVNEQPLRERLKSVLHLPCLKCHRLRRFVVIHKHRCSDITQSRKPFVETI
jgi:hypothetical protein